MSEFKACGRMVGHGTSCVIGYLCGSCEERLTQSKYVEKLEAENARLKEVSNFSEAVACVFDFAKITAANTSCREWDEQLEDFAEDVIEFAPEYKKQWLDIVKLASERDALKAEVKALKEQIS